MKGTQQRLEITGLGLAILVLLGCGPASAPDLTSLRVGLGYDDAVRIVGGQAEHVHDRGVRILEWTFPDGSRIEAGVHDGGLSGLEVKDPPGFSVPSMAARATSLGLQGDMPVARLRGLLEPQPVTIHDTSDRECRWTFGDGVLTAVFLRGELREATFASGDETRTLVEVEDPVVLWIEDLYSEHPWERYRALEALASADEPRVNDALLEMLRVESDVMHRGMAATILADRGDRRAGDLLLNDLHREHVPDDILDALGAVGDVKAVYALKTAAERQSSPRTRRRMMWARKRILARLAPFDPD